ncbi:SsrA-binding protein [Candidatus Campbellbacteria bacterium]|nr:SsrA-binding protein [Candidatus Campbellbacteria bacterium]|tara:strand:+ start:38 stop:481 length:444 start_codon:yes stop_codon:yes gene_type:complete
MNLLVNKTLRQKYEVLDTYESGIKLSGWEVKSLRQKHGSLKEAYISVDAEVWLKNCFIPIYQPGHKDHEGLDPYQQRKLLLKNKEIEKIYAQQKQQGLTVVPVRIYEKENLIKIEIAVARGKKLYDKRKDMRDRTSKRDAERAAKNF